jgi:excisionase family DNA binding protein
MTPPLAYSLAEAAQATSLSVRSLRYLMRTGKLGFARLGRRVVIPHAELDKLLRRATVKSTVLLDADEPMRPKQGNASEASTPEASIGGAVRPAPVWKEPLNGSTPDP